MEDYLCVRVEDIPNLECCERIRKFVCTHILVHVFYFRVKRTIRRSQQCATGPSSKEDFGENELSFLVLLRTLLNYGMGSSV